MGRLVLSVLVGLAAFGFPYLAGAPRADEIRVYAAASLAPVFTDISELGVKSGLPPCRCVHAASSTLARQIERGAPADIFISANPDWVNYLNDREALAAAPREFARGRLALIAPRDSPLRFAFGTGQSLAGALAGDWLALADPDHVPAGIYARAALRSLALWDGVRRKIARTPNVRAALTVVVRGEASAGIVYESDARGEPRVRIVGLIPAASHPPVRYLAALVNPAPGPEPGVYLDFLTSAPVRAILAKYGFRPPRNPRH